MMEFEVSMLEPRIANGWNWQVGTWLVPYQQDRAPVRLEERTSSTAGGAENRPKPRKWPFDGLEARGIKGSEERMRPEDMFRRQLAWLDPAGSASNMGSVLSICLAV